MLKISILTPIYGVEKYIEQCARSLFEQSYASIEYIFVDDCTPDKSIGILQSLLKEYPGRAQQVRIIHHDRNRGVGAARQTALMAATGDYLLLPIAMTYCRKMQLRSWQERQIVAMPI